MEFIGIAMQMVRARLGHDVHYRAGIAAIFGVKVVGQNTKFLYAIGAWLNRW